MNGAADFLHELGHWADIAVWVARRLALSRPPSANRGSYVGV